MSTAFDFFKTSRVFFLGTSDGSKGRVRPFGFIMVRNNALYFCTGKSKDVYKQMVQNPEVEITAMGSENNWLRVRGKVTFDDSREAKAAVFEQAPDLAKIYPGGADNENFATFYLTEAVATLSSFTAPPKTIPLF